MNCFSWAIITEFPFWDIHTSIEKHLTKMKGIANSAAFPINGRLIDLLVQDKFVLRSMASLQIILYGSSQAVYNFKLRSG